MTGNDALDVAHPMARNRRRVCEECGKKLPRKAKAGHGRYCNISCRMKAYRRRKAARQAVA